MIVLSLNLEELWAVHQFVRREGQDGYAEWSKEFMVSVYEGILHLIATKEPEYVVLAVVDDIWQITRQVSRDYKRGQTVIGEPLLLKTFMALTEYYKEGGDSDADTTGPYEGSRQGPADTAAA